MQIFSEKVNSLLLDLERSSEQFWNIPREVGQLLYFLAKGQGAKKILEIGGSNGYSGIWLGEAVRGGMLISIESHKGRYDMAAENFKIAGLEDTIKHVLGHAPEIFPEIVEIKEGNFDMIFMDATKSQHITFLEQTFDLLKPGGMIVADNVLSHAEKMVSFVEMINQNPGLISEVLNIGDGVLIAYKL